MSLVFNGINVDEEVTGGSISMRKSVRVATVINGTLSTSFRNNDIVDGVTLATGDRILLKNQSNTLDNGIYDVNPTGAPTRSEDYDSPLAVSGTNLVCLEGNFNAHTGFICTSPVGVDVIGTDSITFNTYTGDVTLSGFETLSNKTLTFPTISSISNVGTLTLPSITDTLIGKSTNDLLNNKNLTNNSNNITARGLWTGTGSNTVSTYTSPNPLTGQVIKATSASTATWQTVPSGTGVNNQLSIWSGTDTIEGTDDLKFDGVTLNVNGTISTTEGLNFTESATPPNPSVSNGILYNKTGDNGIWWLPSGGPEIKLASSSNIDVQMSEVLAETSPTVLTSASYQDMTSLILNTINNGTARRYIILFSAEFDTENNRRNNLFVRLSVDGVGLPSTVRRSSIRTNKNFINMTIIYATPPLGNSVEIKPQWYYASDNGSARTARLWTRTLIIQGIA
jgi:hypothetical protein